MSYELFSMLEAIGARCISFPVIEQKFPDDTLTLDESIENIGKYN